MRSTAKRTRAGAGSSCPAHAFSRGSAAARGDAPVAAQPCGTSFEPVPDNNHTTRCVTPMPLRGVRATSSSGGGASPCAIAASVLAPRTVLPRTVW